MPFRIQLCEEAHLSQSDAPIQPDHLQRSSVRPGKNFDGEGPKNPMRTLSLFLLMLFVSAPAPPQEDLTGLWNELESCIEDEYRAQRRAQAAMFLAINAPLHPAVQASIDDAMLEAARANTQTTQARMRLWRALDSREVVEKHEGPFRPCPS